MTCHPTLRSHACAGILSECANGLMRRWRWRGRCTSRPKLTAAKLWPERASPFTWRCVAARMCQVNSASPAWRSEEHTSELQSLRHLVCRLLLEKKKEQYNATIQATRSD